ncbi:MAG: TIGR03943 family protein [Veillonella caviae]|nr:TIGR03943 family protein [Veillonella caviae]
MLTELKSKDLLCLVKGALYSTLGICILYLIVTNQYKLYVSPRYELFLLLAGIATLCMGILTIAWAPPKQYKHIWKSIIPILLPIVLLVVPPILVPNTIQVQGVGAVTEDRNDFNFSQDDISEVITINNAAKEPGISKSKKEIVLNSDNYYQTIITMGSHPEEYIGYKLYMTGYVNRDDNTLKANEFTVSRMAMSCCIADVAPIGMTMHKDNGDTISNDEWITIEGSVSTRNFHGRQQPYIEVQKIKNAEPILGYVYP